MYLCVRERARNSCQRILIFEPRIRDGCRDECYFCYIVYLCVYGKGDGELRFNNLAQACVCEKWEEKRYSRWRKRGQERVRGVVGCEQACVARRVILEFQITRGQIYLTGKTSAAPCILWCPAGGWINDTYAQKQCICPFRLRNWYLIKDVMVDAHIFSSVCTDSYKIWKLDLNHKTQIVCRSEKGQGERKCKGIHQKLGTVDNI